MKILNTKTIDGEIYVSTGEIIKLVEKNLESGANLAQLGNDVGVAAYLAIDAMAKQLIMIMMTARHDALVDEINKRIIAEQEAEQKSGVSEE